MTTYELKFGKRALKEWNRLDSSIRAQFERKLREIVRNPHIPSARLHGFSNAYRLKLRKAGYRLGYIVLDEQVIVLVLAVGRRDKDKIYDDFTARYREGEP